MASSSPLRFTNVSRAAVALACGGTFHGTDKDSDGWVVFLITVPPDLDLNDPVLTAPVPALLTWLEMLAAAVRRARGGLR